MDIIRSLDYRIGSLENTSYVFDIDCLLPNRQLFTEPVLVLAKINMGSVTSSYLFLLKRYSI